MNEYVADDYRRKSDGDKAAQYVAGKAGATKKILSAVRF